MLLNTLGTQDTPTQQRIFQSKISIVREWRLIVRLISLVYNCLVTYQLAHFVRSLSAETTSYFLLYPGT